MTIEWSLHGSVSTVVTMTSEVKVKTEILSPYISAKAKKY